MFQIIEKRILAPEIKLFKIMAPKIAAKTKPGNFVVVRLHEKGERIPLTIVETGSDGTISLVVQEVGKTTKMMGKLEKGDYILNLLGPLGKDIEIKEYGQVVIIGGGAGIAEAFPQAKAFKEAGNRVISIIGARNKDILILEEEIRKVSDELFVCTDDGSKGHKGFVTEVLVDLLEQKRRIDFISTIGPTIMMKIVSNLTKPYGIKTLVSLNPIMLDGTGMCGVCRVTVGGSTRFACFEGPTFDGHLVDFDELMSRQTLYIEAEKRSLQEYMESNQDRN